MREEIMLIQDQPLVWIDQLALILLLWLVLLHLILLDEGEHSRLSLPFRGLRIDSIGRLHLVHEIAG